MKNLIKSIIINPDVLICLLFFCPLAYFWGNFVIIGVLYFLSCIILGPLTFQLINTLENKFSILDPKGLSNPVLVLGGGHTPNPNFPFNQQLTQGAMGRVLEGLRVFHHSTSKILILSGPSLTLNHPSQAEIQESMINGMNIINPYAIVRLDTPTTTEEEARAFVNDFGETKPIIVTKAIHMLRAYETFKVIGINPIPAPCNFIFKSNKIEKIKWFIPAFSHAPYLGELLKEGFGLIYLKLRPVIVPKHILTKA